MSDISVEEQVKITIGLGHTWNVIFHNDDKTSMEFVVFALMSVFNKSATEAVPLMLKIHNEGSATAASYSCFDIADQKAKETMSLAREYGFPLKVTVEKQ